MSYLTLIRNFNKNFYWKNANQPLLSNSRPRVFWLRSHYFKGLDSTQGWCILKLISVFMKSPRKEGCCCCHQKMVSLSGKSLCVQKLRCNCTTTDFGGRRRAAKAIDQDRQSTADFSGTISKKESLYYYERGKEKGQTSHQSRRASNQTGLQLRFSNPNASG